MVMVVVVLELEVALMVARVYVVQQLQFSEYYAANLASHAPIVAWIARCYTDLDQILNCRKLC
mgnify:CR=1 FL=1